MADIESGIIGAYYLFDVSESIRLEALRSLTGSDARSTRFTTKVAAPSYVQYQPPPIAIDGEALGQREIEAFRAAFKFFEYGVVSVALTLPFRGSWDQLAALGHSIVDSDRLETSAQRACTQVVERLKDSIVGPRTGFLSEEYFVFGVNRLDPFLSAKDLLQTHGHDIARLLRSERKALSPEERDEVLRHRLSYLADDLIVPTWNAAFVYDTDGVEPALEIFEFANSQLLQFRYYDELLDNELGQIYGQLQRFRWFDGLMGGRYTRAAHRIHALFIDVTEITDRTENALKIVGDVYAARLFQLASGRLGLESWKQAVKEKLKTLDDIYRFTTEQVNMSRGHFLELTVVAILLFELALFLMGWLS
jgi:hypothetical protein